MGLEPTIRPTTECEIKENGNWIKVTVAEALEIQGQKRCISCHGPVRAHRAGIGRAHIEHLRRHSGCPRSDAYDGRGITLHPYALD